MRMIGLGLVGGGDGGVAWERGGVDSIQSKMISSEVTGALIRLM